MDDRPGDAPADPRGRRRPSGPTRRRRSASSTARLDDGWAGHPITEVEEAIGARVVAINRMGAATIPTTRTVAQAGDVLYVAAEVARLGDIDAALHAPPRKGH